MSLVDFFTQTIRRYFVGSKQAFVFKKVDVEKFDVPKIKRIGIYIHIPFCKSICPYCPYNKIKYDKTLATHYLSALLQEIELYHNTLGRIEISSVYIGGGTPTNMIDEIGVVLQTIKENFLLVGDICIETSVADIDEITVAKLKSYGITLISLGVQSFQDKFIKLLGRNYQEQAIKPAVELLKQAGFKSINIDLMFVLADQTVNDVLFDLKQAIELGIDQITTYPLFTFPYTSIGKYSKLKKLKMPNMFTRRKMYKVIHNFLLKNRFERVSVWGFKKGNVPRYSSVTRDYYLGLGAGAASSFQALFYFNTFSIPQYIARLSNHKFPISIKMDISDSLSKNYWFYWKLYDTHFSTEDIHAVFGKHSKIDKLINLFNLFNLCEIKKDKISLTERGTFWIHLIQNYFVLNYINKVWTKSIQNPWPEKIDF